MNLFKRLFSKSEKSSASDRLEVEMISFVECMSVIFQGRILADPVTLYSDSAALNIFTGYLYGALCALNKAHGSDNLLLVDTAFTNLIYSNFKTATDRDQFFDVESRSIDQRKLGIDALHEGYGPLKMMNSNTFVSAVNAGVEDYQSLLANAKDWKSVCLVKVLKANNLCDARLEEMIMADSN